MDLTLAGALVAGLATSLHCAGMCGPLACGVGMLAKSEGERMAAATAYHAGRLTSYTAIGTLCGALGKEPLGWFFHSPAVLLPWALVAALLMLATGLEKKIPRPAFLMRFIARQRFRAQRLPVTAGAGLTGLFTPFLPCGPLYAVFIALLASGSAARGAEVALAFGLGTVPLLWVAQHQFQRLRTKLKPAGMLRIQRGLALITALILAWRLHDTIPLGRPEVVQDQTQEQLPSCCH
ncbi:sulfite exporter TauE/SafE family protein [Luteolibacter flavescens]|uniref:Sulfite exporter TauE/SafE family protein n=1 Tax=Luteolibacter flavescens TaxID=1859460 RepID=A0ABT3FL41_9BACT|nr:sulfite exporter TauE/SafE family protein [Luteolibacter flavescens]MCW1884303.1 sulfite exporter TauE/SafE family protein [Luteolibacter flavescens]